MPVAQKPPMCETKTKRQNTPPDEASDQKRISTTHGTKDRSDEKGMDTIDAVENQKGHDTLDTEDVQMTDPDKQERVGITQDLG